LLFHSDGLASICGKSGQGKVLRLSVMPRAWFDGDASAGAFGMIERSKPPGGQAFLAVNGSRLSSLDLNSLNEG